MVNKNNNTVAIALIAIAVLASLLIVLQRTAGQQTLRWPHVYETSSPYHQQALWAAAEFEQQTNGRYKIVVFPASALGNEVAINESLDLGAVDIIYTGGPFVSRSYPPFSLSEYPYTIDDYAHWQAYRDSQLFADIASAYDDIAGRQTIGLTYYGFRHVTANRPIRHPDDLRNLKIRVPNAPLFFVMPDSTGANATPMPFSEVYLALQQGVVDAQENPLPTIRFKRFYEVQSHINLTGHMSNSLLTLASTRTMDKLGPDDSALLERIVWDAARRASDEVARKERELIDWFADQGITVVEADRDAFREAVKPIYEGDNAAVTRAQYDQLRALLPND